ncbi:MAG: hypothetical protein HOF71_04550 [Chloroflexi bacterium]|nr:hypothetical protein [Chloroflexota bacterium]
MAVRSTPWAQVIQSQSFESPRLFKTIEEEAIGHPLAGRWDDAIDVNIPRRRYRFQQRWLLESTW